MITTLSSAVLLLSLVGQTDRNDLRIPDEIWSSLTEPIGMDPVGFDETWMDHFSGRRFLLPVVEGLFRDVRDLPRYTGWLGSRLLSEAKEPGSVIRTGFYVMGKSAGRGVEAPGKETWGVGWLPDDLAPAEALPIALERLGCESDVGDLPEPVLRLLTRLIVAHVEAERWVRSSRREGDERMEVLLEEISAPWNGETPEAIDRFDEVDLAFLSVGGIIYSRYVQGAIEEFVPGGDFFETVRVETEQGDIVVGSSGDDIHEGETILVVDLGGNDTYRGTHASPLGLGSPVAGVVDLAGDDVYDGIICRGVYGVGLLVDMAGDDTYRGGDSTLGAAWLGVAVMMDAAGNDTYETTGSFTQGAAHGGVGAIIDLAGDDRYSCVVKGQGYGGTLGVGLIVDVEGSDTYEASGIFSGDFQDEITLAQGIGMGRRADFGDGESLAGGIGGLVDGAGDDSYAGKVYSQGAGYWWGLGFLEDREGNDRYACRWYSLGSAPHFALGSCVDLSGDDRYNVGNETTKCQWQGCARDGAVAVFIDGGGNDEYHLRNRCAGSADLGSIALFWDRSGDDAYHLNADGAYGEDPSLGAGVVYEPFGSWRDRMPTVGLFLDSGGTDRYEGTVLAGDGKTWSHHPGPVLWGRGMDTEIPPAWPGDARKDLDIPDAIWADVLRSTTGGDVLGYTRDEMRHFGASRHILRPMEMLFRDVRTIPRFTGRVSQEILDHPEDPVWMSHAAFRMLDARAGREFLVGGPISKSVEDLLDDWKDSPAASSLWESESLKDLPEPVRLLVVRFVGAAEMARPWIQAMGLEAIRDLDRDELYYLASFPWYETGGDDVPDPMPDSFRLLRDVDLRALSTASAGYLARTGVAVKAIREWVPVPFETIEVETPIGTVRIGGPGDDVHPGGAALVVDTGGNDLYLGRTASSLSWEMPVGAVVDLGGNDRYGTPPEPADPDPAILEEFRDGMQAYEMELVDGVLWIGKERDVVVENATRLGLSIGGPDEDAVHRFCWERRAYQLEVRGEQLVAFREDGDPLLAHEGGALRTDLACGFFGIGALYDLEGDDVYLSRRSGLGEGLYGTGVLIDFEGNDSYRTIRSWGQGCGHAGVGILADLSGDDLYRCGFEAQGFGGTLGCGILMDVSGNDRYLADLDARRRDYFVSRAVCFVQGAGFGRRADFEDGHSLAGGFGFLVDGAGDDLYRSGVYGQGTGYWWGMGVLEDRSGNDVHQMFQYGIGGSPHFGIGVCVNLSGDDTYNVDSYIQGQSLGQARDGAIGIFYDGDGKDRYRVGSVGAGHGDLNSVGLFWDRRGDDEYEHIPWASNSRGFGYGVHFGDGRGTFREDMPTTGVFLDTGGKDVYRDALDHPKAKEDGILSPARDDHRWVFREETRYGFGLDVNLYQ